MKRAGFTLTETMVAMAVGSIMLAGLLVTSTSLQRWFSSAKYLIGTQQDQGAIFDYIARDIRRASGGTIAGLGGRLDLTMPDQTVRAADNSLQPPAFNQGVLQYGANNTTVSYYLNAGGGLVRDDGASVITLSSVVSSFHLTSSTPPAGAPTGAIGSTVTVDLVFYPSQPPGTTPAREVTTTIRWRNYPGFVK
jgi:prepilin-type N-terminal cleavage/methylation domain-containing protein